jgi:hypothetical protein
MTASFGAWDQTVVPCGAWVLLCAYPGLTPWAKLCRPFGAGLWRCCCLCGVGELIPTESDPESAEIPSLGAGRERAASRSQDDGEFGGVGLDCGSLRGLGLALCLPRAYALG